MLCGIIIFLTAILAFLIWASASICSGVYVKAFCKENTTSKVVYLTFDDGPVAGRTDKVLDVLRDRSASATFFVIGDNVRVAPHILKRIVSEGHKVGVHSSSHKWSFPLQGNLEMRNDIAGCKALIEKVTGERVTLFRPPFGVENPTVAKVARDCGLMTVGWSIRTFDTARYSKRDGMEKILKVIDNELRPGVVVLLHDRLPDSEILLTAVIDLIERRGYCCNLPLPL